MSGVLLDVRGLKTSFRTLRGRFAAVDGVSFTLRQGEIIGMAGESGCGKSVTSQSIMRLYDEKSLVSYEGQILFEGQDLLKKSAKQMRMIRGGGIAMIFQDALSCLNPLYTIGNQIAEAVLRHRKVSRKQALADAEELLRLTGVPAPEKRIRAYPHELSGGMRQRAMIAMALACRPRLLIADEPTTALDVTIQAQILKLITDLNAEFGMSVILVTHDLGVVSQTCGRLIIMYLGHIVEEGPVRDILRQPLHPYTQGLVQSIPTLQTRKDEQLYMIRGVVPALGEAGAGCRFCGRCPLETPACGKTVPELIACGKTRKVRCLRVRAQEAG
ncbi:MAG: ABC transporter ATP-binding protein [Treponema sp.]|jgi:oligopeptide/dipeptide ABC transporter ATP-binding protein|nr:ABC transporter ATP-binding protein [Treponema sp.]